MRALEALLVLTLLGTAMGQSVRRNSCLMVKGQTVCYYLYDVGASSGVSYDNGLCNKPSHPDGTLATIETMEVLELFKSWSTSMADSTYAWFAGKKYVNDIYFRTKTGKIIPLANWPYLTSVIYNEEYCASFNDSGVWETQGCASTLRYYVCQDRTDPCPVEDVCDRRTPYRRPLDEWCFWPYDHRFSDNEHISPSEGAWFHCRELGGHVMSLHNTDELAIVNNIMSSFEVQSAYYVYDSGLSFHFSMHGNNYRWRNGYAGVGLGDLGLRATEEIYVDRREAFEEFLEYETVGTNPISLSFLEFDDEVYINFICEAPRVDLCQFHAFKAPHAVITSNFTHVLYECEKGYQFDATTTTKLFDCSCNFDALANITRDLACELIPYCEAQMLELGKECECPTGYKWDESCLKCVDIDECEEQNGGCHQLCENNDGGYECTCLAGYVPHVNLTNLCVDTDECLDENACPFNSLCINNPGSFVCLCHPGFEYDATTHTCDDINECLARTYVCGLHSTCLNHVGSYTCKCDQGYRATDNHECRDPYSLADFVFRFTIEGPYNPDYADRGSEAYRRISHAIDQQFFSRARQMTGQSTFLLDLSPGSGGVAAQAIIGLSTNPDYEQTKDILLAVWLDIKAKNFLLNLEGQSLPLNRRLFYDTPLSSGVFELNDVCSVYVALAYCIEGTCETLTENQPTCRCNEGYTGKRCDVEEEKKISVWNSLTIALLLLVLASLLSNLLLCYCFMMPRRAIVPAPAQVIARPRRWNSFSHDLAPRTPHYKTPSLLRGFRESSPRQYS